MTTFRFRPRYRVLAWIAIGGGAALAAAALALADDARWLAMGIGGGGAVLGTLYLVSPAWRYTVHVDDAALEVVDGHGDRRFRIAWDEIERVVASPKTRTCVVSGGGTERTLIVPGPGAPAPYDIADKDRLFDEIMKRAPAGRIEEVELVEQAQP